MLAWTFRSELDRKLILGIIDRNVELDAEWNADTIDPPRELPTGAHRDSMTKKDQQVFDQAELNINQDDNITLSAAIKSV